MHEFGTQNYDVFIMISRSAPQSQAGDSLKLYLNSESSHLLQLVLILYSITNNCGGKTQGINCWINDLTYILWRFRGHLPKPPMLLQTRQ